MLPILQIFGVALQVPPMTVLIGVMLALSLGERAARRVGASPEIINSGGIIAFVAGLLGARLGYVLLNWSAYAGNWSAALALNATGFLAVAGWLCAALALGIYLWRQHALTPSTFDALAPAIGLFLAFWALSSLFSGDGFGTPATLPWAISLWGAQRHPVQAYEAVLLLLLTLALWRRLTTPPTGRLSIYAIAGVAAIRIVVDGFRADAALLEGIRVSQLASVLICVMALTMGQRFKRAVG